MRIYRGIYESIINGDANPLTPQESNVAGWTILCNWRFEWETLRYKWRFTRGMDYKDLSCGVHWTMWDTGPVKTKKGWASRNLLPTSQVICGPNSTHLAKRESRLKQPRLNQNLILTWFIQPVLQMSDPQKIMIIYGGRTYHGHIDVRVHV